jgi:tRNA threonylcarbamoyl adenosine modification protein YeaZ
MARGQAEHLMPMLEGFLSENGKSWSDLTRIGVGTGPGNFTGIRISVSAARGLSLGLGIPAIGVSTLEALRHIHPSATVAVVAPRNMIYAQHPNGAPTHIAQSEAPDAVFALDPSAMITALAEIAAQADAAKSERPKPLYIKPADAAPARDTAPVILP